MSYVEATRPRPFCQSNSNCIPTYETALKRAQLDALRQLKGVSWETSVFSILQSP